MQDLILPSKQYGLEPNRAFSVLLKDRAKIPQYLRELAYSIVDGWVNAAQILEKTLIFFSKQRRIRFCIQVKGGHIEYYLAKN